MLINIRRTNTILKSLLVHEPQVVYKTMDRKVHDKTLYLPGRYLCTKYSLAKSKTDIGSLCECAICANSKVTGLAIGIWRAMSQTPL